MGLVKRGQKLNGHDGEEIVLKQPKKVILWLLLLWRRGSR